MLRYTLLALVVVSAGIAANAALAYLPFWHDAIHYVYVALVAALVVRLRMGFDHERELARSDSLTGLANRRTFLEVAESHIQRMRRDGRACTVLYIDIDGFKHVNDRNGHQAGDILLQSVASTLALQVRAGDTVARLGGDEFAVILEGEHEEPVVSRLYDALREDPRARDWGVGFSIGAVTFRAPPASAEDMIRRADAAMYVAKERGNQVVYRVA